MDIQKEREAFEAWYCRNHTGLKQSDLAKFRTLSGYSFSDSLKINISWEAWQAKAQAVPEGFVLLPKKATKKMLDAGYEAHDGFFSKGAVQDVYVAMIEAQDLSNNATPELVNNDVTYVIELKGYEAIENARVALKKKGYKTWDYTDKDSIDDNDLYVLCVCPSTPNDSALVKGTFKSIHQGKFTYIQTDLESCPDAQEPAND